METGRKQAGHPSYSSMIGWHKGTSLPISFPDYPVPRDVYKRQNVGKTRNKGVEFTLNTVNIRNKDFEWSTGIIFSLNRDTVSYTHLSKKNSCHIRLPHLF